MPASLRKLLATAAVLILALLAAAPLVLARTDFDGATLDGVAERARKAFDVPGIAVAVVKDGNLVMAKGYGVRKLGSPEPVTRDTLFGVASNTKAFTAALLAMLVDEGKLAWDDPVTKHLPWFQMADPYITREMTVRDLLVHRSGLALGAGDLMYFPPSNLSEDEIARRLRHVPIGASFRSRYAYDNILYLVAGKVIESVSGKAWHVFLRERIFEPLGMSRTLPLLRLLPPNENIAMPHARGERGLEVLQPSSLDNNAPAASILSSLDDMSKWVIAQLNKGEFAAGKRLFSEKQSKEMWTPHTIMPIADPAPSLAAAKPNFLAYGLGWNLWDYRGRKIVHHTGGLAGMVTRVTLVPDLKLGIIVLTNQEAGGAFNAITYTVLDQYLGAPATDWVDAFIAAQKKREAEAADEADKAAKGRNAASRPSLPLAGYAGRYRDPWYGDVVVEHRNGALAVRFTHTPLLTGTLEHWQYDTFIARWNDRTLLADAYMTFVLGPDGQITDVRMKAVSPLTDFSYDFHHLALKPAPKDAKPY